MEVQPPEAWDGKTTIAVKPQNTCSRRVAGRCWGDPLFHFEIWEFLDQEKWPLRAKFIDLKESSMQHKIEFVDIWLSQIDILYSYIEVNCIG